MKYVIFYPCVLFLLSACQYAFLPHISTDIQTFVPQPEPNIASQFPHACSWHDLIRVIDGDTIEIKTLLSTERVRFLGVNTPELKSPYTQEEAYGVEAKNYVVEYFKSQSTEPVQVCLIRDLVSDKKDKYERLLAHIFNKKGDYINLQTVCDGWGRTMSFPLSNKKAFSACQKSAKKSKTGIWKDT